MPIAHPLVVHDFVADDFAIWPAACKAYPEALPRVPLPREWPPAGAAATAVLAGHAAAEPRAPDLPALGRLLHLSAGVVRVMERADRPTLLLRAAGSTGGRFPLELYVSAAGDPALRPGAEAAPIRRTSTT